MITVLTPTYNRSYILHKAYRSLINQTNQDFEWLIVDDGSTDDTKQLIEGFIGECKIKIRYIRKENHGKHTAINVGVKHIDNPYLVILDSDDSLLPNAIEEIDKYWKKYGNNQSIACISFLRKYPNDEVIGKRYNESEIISNNIDFRYNQALLGDMCETFRVEVLKKYPFPVFGNERFLSEAIVWNQIALKYDTVYVNNAIYMGNYLEDGLSKNILINRFKCPKGAAANANIFLLKRFKLTIRLKNAILYDGFSMIANNKCTQYISEANSKTLAILFLPAGLLFKFWLKIVAKKQ